MLNREVGFALNNGHRQPSLSGPKSANKRHRRMQGVQRKSRPKDRASIPFLFDLASIGCSPPDLIGFSQRAISSAKAWRSGLLRSDAIPVTPMSCIRALIAGVSMASCVTLLSCVQLGRVRLWAGKGSQVAMSIPSNPCSRQYEAQAEGRAIMRQHGQDLFLLAGDQPIAAPRLPHR